MTTGGPRANTRGISTTHAHTDPPALPFFCTCVCLCVCLVIPEVLKLIERELKLDEPPEAATAAATATDSSSSALTPRQSSTLLSGLPTHIAAWLTLNSMRMEQLQFFQLCLQNLHSVWRKKAFASLFEDSCTPSPQALVSLSITHHPMPSCNATAIASSHELLLSPVVVSSFSLSLCLCLQASRRHLRFDLNAVPAHPNIFWQVECLNLFKCGISFSIDEGIPATKSFFSTLKSLLSQHATFVQHDWQCTAIGQVLTQALEAASAVIPTHAFDREMINEQEREQEQEKQQEVLKDPRAQRNEEQHQAWKIEQLQSADALFPPSASLSSGRLPSRMVSTPDALSTSLLHPFYSLASFALDGRGLPLTFPRYLLLSHNYYRQSWGALAAANSSSKSSAGHRRLKNIYVLLEWVTPRKQQGAATATGATAATSFLPPPVLTPLQADRFDRAFRMLDEDRDAKIAGAEIESVSLSRERNRGALNPSCRSHMCSHALSHLRLLSCVCVLSCPLSSCPASSSSVFVVGRGCSLFVLRGSDFVGLRAVRAPHARGHQAPRASQSCGLHQHRCSGRGRCGER